MFQTTRWSLILAARSGVEDRRIALEELCRAYRAPVLTYVRRHVAAREEAEDLTQAFFLKFLDQRFDTDADPQRGRFRVYLLTTVKHFLANAHDHANAAKRGGGVQMATLDESDLAIYGDPKDSPEVAFERAWALTVFNRALERLRQESVESGKQLVFERLQEFLIETPEPTQYQALAQELGMRRHTIAVTVQRMRERLRERVRTELAETVGDSKDMDTELRTLHHTLSGAQ